MSALCEFQYVQPMKEPPYCIPAPQVLPMDAPRGDYNASVRRQPNQRRVVLGANRIVKPLHHERIGRTISKDIRHAQCAVSPRLRVPDAAPHGRIVLCFVRRARVQSDEHRIVARCPASPQGIAPCAAWAEGGSAFDDLHAGSTSMRSSS